MRIDNNGRVGIGTANKSVMARLQKLLEDGIQPEEVDQVIQSLQQLGVQVNAAFGSQDVTINKLLDGLATTQTRLLETERRVDKLVTQKNTKVP